jgi:hypothetical protein
MTRGKKPGTVQAGSLVAKLLSLRVGETIHLDDKQTPGKATIAERSVRNVIAKSPALHGLTFATERWLAVRSFPVEAKAILAVRRLT